MKAAVLADIHGSLKQLKKIRKHLRNVDLIIIAGDIAGTVSLPLVLKSILKYKRISREKYMELVFGESYTSFLAFQMKSTERIIDFFAQLNKPCFIIHGNADAPEVIEKLEKLCSQYPLIQFLNIEVTSYKDLLITGYGYTKEADYSTIQTPTVKTLSEIKEDLQNLKSKILSFKQEKSNMRLLGVFHDPPFNTKLDYIPFKNIHGGNPEILTFITNELKFDFVFAGHIHESRNFEINETTLLLNPGPLVNGYWTIVNLETKEPIFMKTKGFNFIDMVYKVRKIFS